VEAKPLANIKSTTVQKFFWQNIVSRFGVPRELTVDNGKQFDCYTFKEYCKTLGTQAKFSSVHHPQSNAAVERANGLIFSGIKKCLFDQKKGKWVDELPKVIWSHNTTVSRATGFTPFRLLFGTEVMTPEEIKNESMRVLKGKEIEEMDKKVEKDMIELTILEAAENIEKYQRETRAWRDKKVVRKDIKTGDLVLKRKKTWKKNFCRDLSMTSCKRQHLLLGYSALATDRLSKGTDTYLHPLLGPSHRLQVACHCHQVNKIIRQKLESTTTSRGGLGHRCRTDRLGILDFLQTDDYFQA
jgi:hypothetical protein